MNGIWQNLYQHLSRCKTFCLCKMLKGPPQTKRTAPPIIFPQGHNRDPRHNSERDISVTYRQPFGRGGIRDLSTEVSVHCSIETQ